MSRPHVIVLHRWRSDYALYDRYFSHQDFEVSYIVVEPGAVSVPPAAAEVVVLPSLDDAAAVTRVATELVARHGIPRAVIALKEDDLLTAASLRERWDCPGPRPAETIRFRDKDVMCGVVARAGHRVPPWTTVSDAEAVGRFAQEHGWPLIVKPTSAHSSKGVRLLEGPAQVSDVDFGQGMPMLAQVFNPHPIYYVDGVRRDGRLGPWRASRYLNSCLEFRTGDYVGAVEEDDPEVNDVIAAHTAAFLAALSDGDLVFHLELFLEPGPDGPVCSFLEVGARPGGAEIPYLWRDVHGYDLMNAAAAIQLGQSPPGAEGADLETVAGLLLVPVSVPPPCRIIDAPTMLGLDLGPYAEVIPRAGDVVPLSESVFEHAGGRFRFRATTSKEVERAVMSTLAAFHVHAEALS